MVDRCPAIGIKKTWPRCAVSSPDGPTRNSVILVACRVSGVRDREERDRGRGKLERTCRRFHRYKMRKIIWTGLQNCSIQLHDGTLKMVRRQRVALTGRGQSQGGGGRPVGIDGQ